MGMWAKAEAWATRSGAWITFLWRYGGKSSHVRVWRIADIAGLGLPGLPDAGWNGCLPTKADFGPQ